MDLEEEVKLVWNRNRLNVRFFLLVWFWFLHNFYNSIIQLCYYKLKIKQIKQIYLTCQYFWDYRGKFNWCRVVFIYPKSLPRLCLQNAPSPVLARSARSMFTTSKLAFNVTQPLCAEPLKKKKRIDPQVIKAREERRRKKIEKQIRRLEKNARQLKPIDELEVPLVLMDERE